MMNTAKQLFEALGLSKTDFPQDHVDDNTVYELLEEIREVSSIFMDLSKPLIAKCLGQHIIEIGIPNEKWEIYAVAFRQRCRALAHGLERAPSGRILPWNNAKEIAISVGLLERTVIPFNHERWD
jgi:hypothetical protein